MTDLPDEQTTGLSEAAAIMANGLRRSALAPVWVACAGICFDIPVLATALWFAQYTALPEAEFSATGATLVGLVASTIVSFTLAGTGCYNPRHLRSSFRSLSRTVFACLIPVGIMALSIPAQTSQIFLVTATLALGAVIVPTRLGGAIIARWMLDTHLMDRRAVIAGGGENAKHLIRGLARRPDNDIRLHGIFDDRDDVRSPIQILGIPKIGSYDDLITFVRLSEIDLVIISLPLQAEERIDWLIDAFRVLPVEVRLSAYSRDYAFSQSDRDPLIAAIRRSFAPERRLTKRIFDIVFAVALIIPALPIMAAAAAAIRLESKGPVFFCQNRHGYNDRIIEVLKFRSMYEEDADPEARQVVCRNDPRVTRVGKFLRRSSLDELPQLFNVLRGDLSLVGPRPHAVDAVSSGQERFSRIVDGYSARHRLPPGITGWAQINGWRGEINDRVKLRARFEHDLYYIENWSIWLDLKILLRTPLSLFDTSSAY